MHKNIVKGEYLNELRSLIVKVRRLNHENFLTNYSLEIKTSRKTYNSNDLESLEKELRKDKQEIYDNMGEIWYYCQVTGM